jgi:hypothetical protein
LIGLGFGLAASGTALAQGMPQDNMSEEIQPRSQNGEKVNTAACKGKM